MTTATLDSFKDIAIIAGGAIGFITLWQGIYQYAKQGRFTRVNQFVSMRRRFLEDETYRRIMALILEGSPAVAAEPVLDRRALAGFFEELAIMMNSGVLKPEVVYYMFGSFALKIDESKGFWHGLDRDSHYWTVFRTLIADLREYEAKRRPASLRGIKL
ncbi:MAG: hypothetical protein JNJ45_07375 [Chthonomonas sp.]|nr:hypothetical protein [Chthonomonas sp.]